MADQKDLIVSDETAEEGLELKVLELKDGVLRTNAADILKMVEAQLVSYNPSNYPSERVQEAKAARAELNAAADALNKKRLEFERSWMKPFNDFKETVNLIVIKIKRASLQIDEIIKKDETQKKGSKKAEIQAYFDSLNFSLVPIEKIWEDRWLNQTVKIASVKADIDAIVRQIKEDLLVLDRVEEPGVKEHYLLTLNLSEALAHADQLKAARVKLEDAAHLEAASVPPDTEPAPEPITSKDSPVPVFFGGGGFVVGSSATRSEPKTVLVKLSNPTESQVDMIKAFLDATGIQYLIA